VNSRGRAKANVVDALDETAVHEYFDSVVKQEGRVDVGFNAMGPRVAAHAKWDAGGRLAC
jgi:hypothetical protein